MSDAPPGDAPPPAPPPADAAPPAAPSSPAPAAPRRPEWTPPDTFADRFSRWSIRAVRGALAAFGLLSLTLFVLWLVPTIAVSRSPAYALAREHMTSHRVIRDALGAPVTADRFPDWYRLGAAGGDAFRFDLAGPQGKARAEVRVLDGRVVESRVAPTYDD